MRIAAPLGMNHRSFRTIAGERSVNRAIGELRRGTAVVIVGENGERVLALPAETATRATLEEFLAEGAADPVLILAPSRAVNLDLHPGVTTKTDLTGGIEGVAIPLLKERLDAVFLRKLADPTARPVNTQLHLAGPAGAAPFGGGLAQAGLQAAKLARLLPAVLMAAQAEQLPATASGLLDVHMHDVLAYPADTSRGLTRAAEATVPLEEAGDTRVVAFRPPDGGIEHLAILIGHPESAADPLVRVHSECFTGDLLGSRRCDCGPQLHQAIRRMAADGAGVLLYMAQEGRGIGLVNKLRAYSLQDGTPAQDGVAGVPGLDTLDANRALGYGADERSFAAAATMLKRLGIIRIRLLTNNPEKIAGLTAHGIEVTGRVSHAIAANGINDGYLETKARRFGHLLG